MSKFEYPAVVYIIIVTEFAKRGLIHASNFPNLKRYPIFQI